MPVLPAEPNILPENLFADPSGALCSDQRWWVLHTRARAEKSLARRLFRQEISFFLPLYARSRTIQRRCVRSLLPLFPGYLFVRCAEENRRRALETNLVVSCLRVDDQRKISSELAMVSRLIESGAPLAPEERLRPGMRAVIQYGPLAGLSGTIVRRGKAWRFVIEVDFLQRGASVEIDASMIQPV